MRDVARERPEVDVAVVHPGVVKTDLGARRGVLGFVVRLVKRQWESPERCSERLVAFLERPRWSPPGDARWFVLDQRADEQPWPCVVDDSAAAVRAALRTGRAAVRT